jgi:hypothetical protein
VGTPRIINESMIDSKVKHLGDPHKKKKEEIRREPK